MRRAVPFLVIALGAIVFVGWLRGRSGSIEPESATQPSITTGQDQIADLKRQIAEQEIESAEAVANYLPTIKAQIDDLGSPVADLLRHLPGVVQVDVGVRATNPNSRIVHLRDWHFVPKELYALDLEDGLGRKLTAAEIDRLHQELLLEVELVQLEQMAVLRCLIQHHGLKRVFSEGFSQRELDAYREKIAVLKAMDEEQIPLVRNQLNEVRTLIESSTGETKEEAKAIESQLVTMLNDHKHRLLEVGAAGRLLISGELEDVLPLEESETFEQANPISPSGGVKLDPVKIDARHDAQVKAVLMEGPVAVIVLGGAHDLSASVRRFGGNCEYLRVTTKRVRGGCGSELMDRIAPPN